MKRIIIVGAGVAGQDVVREIRRNKKRQFLIIGFIDDDPLKRDQVILGVKVLGNIFKLSTLITKEKVEEVIIAIPSADGDKISKYVEICSKKKVAVVIVPRVKEIIEGRAHLNTLRKVRVEDLVGRPVVKEDVGLLKSFFKDKTVFITGAAGSIGSELSKQVVAYNPKLVIFVDWWENGMFYLRQDLEKDFTGRHMLFVIGNIQNKHKMNWLFNEYKPDYVYHAAAYKHVPAMEENPEEAIENNIFGTQVLAEVAVRHKTKKFVLVSTDKAADPKSVMGMTKLMAEKVVASYANRSTRFVRVRFGNVLDSFGSVVPIFRKQIEEGGPVTVTDKRMTRFFMTIPEAVNLILKSSLIGKGNELFILDMGKPVKIVELAEKMIRLSGYIPYKEIKIVFTGRRKGEKLHEKLFTKDELFSATSENRIFVLKIISQRKINLKQLKLNFKRLIKNNNTKYLISYLRSQIR